jgi:hypothetical protein
LKGISLTILALAKLEVCWRTDLNDEVKKNIRNSIATQNFFDEHALSSLLFGLGKMSRKWSELQVEVRQTLKQALVVVHLHQKCSSIGVCNSLHGFYFFILIFYLITFIFKISIFFVKKQKFAILYNETIINSS